MKKRYIFFGIIALFILCMFMSVFGYMLGELGSFILKLLDPLQLHDIVECMILTGMLFIVFALCFILIFIPARLVGKHIISDTIDDDNEDDKDDESIENDSND